MVFKFLTGVGTLARKIAPASKYLSKRQKAQAIKSYKNRPNLRKLYNKPSKDPITKITHNKFSTILKKEIDKLKK
jgi:hypothetical protein